MPSDPFSLANCLSQMEDSLGKRRKCGSSFRKIILPPGRGKEYLWIYSFDFASDFSNLNLKRVTGVWVLEV